MGYDNDVLAATVDGESSGERTRLPSRGGVLRVMNSHITGSLTIAKRRASRASSSRIGAPPISKITRPGGTLDAQNSKCPFPLPIRVSLPFWHTGISGKIRMKTLAPLTFLIFLFMTSSVWLSCLEVSLAPFPLIRMPHSPYANVVPFVDPPIGMGSTPLWRWT